MQILQCMITLSLVVLITFIKTDAQLKPSSSAEEKAVNAVKLLWSPKGEDIEHAKREIIKLQEKAIDPLLNLLEELITNHSTPRFVTGKEAEGARIWKNFLDSPQNINDELLKIEITARLKIDAIELLGELRAVQAIPILINIMENRIKDNWLRQRTQPEMDALIKIGEPAVSLLIKSVEDAEKKARSMKFGPPQITDEEKEAVITSYIVTVQTRAIMVLGEIGDENALPILERLLEESKAPNKICPDIRYIQSAITKIKKQK